MQQGVELLKRRRLLLHGAELRRGIVDRQRLKEVVLRGRALLYARLKVAVEAEHVVRDQAIALFVDVVRYDEEQVETREQGVRKRDILMRVLVYVVLQCT